MLINNEIKYIRSLSLKKYRQKYNNFVIEGEKMIMEAVFFSSSNIIKIFCLQEFAEKYNAKLMSVVEKLEIISAKELKKMSGLKSPNAGIALMEIHNKELDKLKSIDFIVYLDDIRDPGNMGTIIRTCDWFGVDCLVVSSNSTDIYNPKVLQSSMGSIFRLPVIKMDFDVLYSKLKRKNHKYYGTLLNGENIYNIKYELPLVVITGNESKGIKKDIISKLDKKITIPRYNDNVESLNASIATSLVISEIKHKI